MFALHLPVVSFVFIGLAADALLRDWGIASRTARALTPLLCVLGGDLSALFPARGIPGAERTAHFLAFSSFSAESLYYNPWMLGLPLVLATLVLAGRWLRGEGRGWLWLAAWVLATLWQSKLFARAPLVAAAAVAAIVRRDRRLASLALLAGAMALPWIGLTLASSGGGLRPLVFAPLQPVRLALAVHPSWHALRSVVDGGRAWPVQALGLAVSTILVVCGGFAVRLLGGAGLARRMRQDAERARDVDRARLRDRHPAGLHARGRPGAARRRAVPDPPAAAAMDDDRPAARALAGGSRAPQVGRAASRPPRLRQPGGVRAAEGGARAVHVAPLDGPLSPRAGRRGSGRGRLARPAATAAREPGRRLASDHQRPRGARPFYAAALSSRRLCAFVETFSVPARVADERRRLVAELYDTTDAARAGVAARRAPRRLGLGRRRAPAALRRERAALALPKRRGRGVRARRVHALGVTSGVMPARKLDGAATARAIREELKDEAAALTRQGRRPGLGVLLVGDDPASAVYVKSKTRACEELGLFHETHHLSAAATTSEVVAQVEDYNRRSEVHGILVQLPLPAQVDAEKVLRAVNPAKDVDGFHPENVGLLVQKRPRFVACTPAGIMELLRREGIELSGRRAVVVGHAATSWASPWPCS